MILEKEICHFLSEQGFRCTLDEVNGVPWVITTLEISNQSVQLMLVMEDRFISLPTFLLLEPCKFGKLAHVNLESIGGKEFGSVCVNAPESISVNFDRPLLLIKDSLERHIALLKSVIEDRRWNERELLREFYSNWLLLCSGKQKPLLINFSEPVLQSVDVFEPPNGVEYGLHSYYMAHPSDGKISKLSEMQFAIRRSNRKVAGKAVVIPINTLTPAPNANESIEQWYLNTLENLPNATLRQLRERFGQWRDKHYWLVFTAITVDNNRTWFALKFNCRSKRALPLRAEKLGEWQLTPVSVRVFNQENVVQRGGGMTSLSDKKVALVGIGSVGSEIAHKLSAAGVRHLDLVDPEPYEIDNLYRHLLPQSFVDMPKSMAMAYQCHTQFPWSDATHSIMDIMEFSKQSRLGLYDLIIIAIGNPTQERLFKQYLLDQKVEVTTLNCWLEGYGIGGHAALDVAGQEGCLLCAYVDLDEGSRGLKSNLNFIEANQDVMKSIAGCGNQFISYGAVSSAQTAVMTSSLAIRYLEGKQSKSCKVSWKGDDDDARANNIALTHRYYHFTDSLEVAPLFNEECDVCGH